MFYDAVILTGLVLFRKEPCAFLVAWKSRFAFALLVRLIWQFAWRTRVSSEIKASACTRALSLLFLTKDRGTRLNREIRVRPKALIIDKKTKNVAKTVFGTNAIQFRRLIVRVSGKCVVQFSLFSFLGRVGTILGVPFRHNRPTWVTATSGTTVSNIREMIWLINTTFTLIRIKMCKLKSTPFIKSTAP